MGIPAEFKNNPLRWAMMDQLKYYQEKGYKEGLLSISAQEALDKKLSNKNLPKSLRRSIKQQIPSNVIAWFKEHHPDLLDSYKKYIRKGAELKNIASQDTNRTLEGRAYSHKEHASALFGGGSDDPKSQFTGSGYYNIHMGPKDSFSVQTLDDLGRPSNWMKSASDFVAFGEGTMIQLSDADWIKLQQGLVTTDQLISQKFEEMDLDKSGLKKKKPNLKKIIEKVHAQEEVKSAIKHSYKRNSKGELILDSKGKPIPTNMYNLDTKREYSSKDDYLEKRKKDFSIKTNKKTVLPSQATGKTTTGLFSQVVAEIQNDIRTDKKVNRNTRKSHKVINTGVSGLNISNDPLIPKDPETIYVDELTTLTLPIGLV